MNLPALTKRQAAVLAFIREYLRANNRPPTYREIMVEFVIKGPNGVKCHIDALKRKGYIEIDAKVSRGIVLMTVSGACPCCGRAMEDASQTGGT